MLNAMSNVTAALIALVLSPFIVHRLGLRAFGFWSVIVAIVSFVQIADGGLPVVGMRYVARALAKGDTEALRTTVATVVLTLAVIAGILVGFAIALPHIAPVGLTRQFPHGSDQAITWSGVGLALAIVATGLGSVTRGAERWDIDAVIWIAGQTAGAITTFILLTQGGGLPSLGQSTVVSGLVVLGGYAFSAARHNALGWHGIGIDRGLLRELRQQGTALQVVALVGVTNAQADRLMLLPFASLRFIGAYALGSRIAVALRSFPLNAFGPLMARFAKTHSLNGEVGVRSLYVRALKAVAAYPAPALMCVYFACFPGVLAWLGAGFTISAAGAVILGAGYAVNILTGPGTTAAIASGRAQLDRDYNLLGLTLNLVLTPLLGLVVGPWGVVGATSLGLIISSYWLLQKADKMLTIRAATSTLTHPLVRRAWFGAAVIGGATIAATVGVAPASRIDNLFLALGSCTLGMAWLARFHPLNPKQSVLAVRSALRTL